MPYHRNWIETFQEIQLKREIARTSRIVGADSTDRELDVDLLAGTGNSPAAIDRFHPRHLRGERESGGSSRPRFPVGLVCGCSLAIGFAHLGGRLHFRPGADLSARRLAAHPDPLRRGWAHGLDGLLAAIRVVHPVLLSLNNRSLRTYRTRYRAGAHGHPLRGAGGVQQLVAAAISLWPHGVVVARHDLR